MSHTIQNYEPSSPTDQLNAIRYLIKDKRFCPSCNRVAKWYYPYHDSDRYEDKFRCSNHEIIPAPGPEEWPLERKVTQMY